VIPGSYVLAHSPLTGPAAWGTLPSLLREQSYDVVVINVQDDEKAPFAERYVGQSTAQISAAEPAPPTSFVAHSGAGPLLPAITASLPRSYRRGGSIFLDAGLPRPGQPSRLDLLREENGSSADEFLNSLRSGVRFPAWTVDDLADIVPNLDDRMALVESLQPRARDFLPSPCQGSTTGRMHHVVTCAPRRRTTSGSPLPKSAVGQWFAAISGIFPLWQIPGPRLMRCSN